MHSSRQTKNGCRTSQIHPPLLPLRLPKKLLQRKPRDRPICHRNPSVIAWTLVFMQILTLWQIWRRCPKNIYFHCIYSRRCWRVLHHLRRFLTLENNCHKCHSVISSAIMRGYRWQDDFFICHYPSWGEIIIHMLSSWMLQMTVRTRRTTLSPFCSCCLRFEKSAWSSSIRKL